MSINIFQFLKQGTTLNHATIKENQELAHKIAPKQITPNQTFFETGKFNQEDRDDPTLKKKKKIIMSEEELQTQMKEAEKKNKVLQKKHHIKVEGTDIPLLQDNFTHLFRKYKINQNIARGLAMQGFSSPTPVQMQSLPALLEDRNILVTAPTGTGKTLSYLIPILHKILSLEQPCKQTKNKKKKKEKEMKYFQALIIVPCQQLSTQVKQEIDKLYLELSQGQQNKIVYECLSELTEEQKSNALADKPLNIDILVATPLSLINLFKNSQTTFKSLKYLILDECDKFFEDSFSSQIQTILELMYTSQPIYGLFSATIQHHLEQLIKQKILTDCIRIEIGGKNKVLSKVQQSIEYCTNEYGKLVELKNMICENKFVPPVLIFVQEKKRTKQLYYELKKILKNSCLDISQRVEVLSADKSKEERQEILKDFANGVYWVLITTDLVARGLDFQQVNLVINYDFPNSMLTYIHRVGRTGRAERVGTAVTFFTEEDKPLVRSLSNLLQVSGCDVPQWLLQMPKPSKKLKKKLQKYPMKRLPVGIADKVDKNWEMQMEKRDKKLEKVREQKKIEKEEESEWIMA